MMAAQPLPSCDNPMFLDNANYPHGWGVVVVNPPPMLRATAIENENYSPSHCVTFLLRQRPSQWNRLKQTRESFPNSYLCDRNL